MNHYSSRKHPFLSGGLFFVLFLAMVTSVRAADTAGTAPPNANQAALTALATQMSRIGDAVNQLVNPLWEYRRIHENKLVNMDEQFNGLGAEGWELVTLTQEGSYLFKRRLVR